MDSLKSQIHKIDLKPMKFVVQQRISKMGLYSCVEPEVILLQEMEDLILMIEKTLSSERLGIFEKDISFEQYKSWWQFFKKQYFPRWLLKKFPVKYIKITKRVEVDVKAVYPRLAYYGSDDRFSKYILHSQIEELPEHIIEVGVKNV